MIDAAESLLRSLRRSTSRLRTLLLCGFRLLLLLLPLLRFGRLLMLWLCGFRLVLLLLPLLRFARLLMLWLCRFLLLLLLLLPLLRFALLLSLLLALCVGRSNGSEEQTQGPCADS
jgi:hypothetical protein